MPITGRVEAVSQKEKGYGVRIGTQWFNGWDKCPVEKGDVVEVDFETKKTDDRIYRNIRKITKTEETDEEIKSELIKTKRASVMIAKDLMIAKGKIPPDEGAMFEKLFKDAKAIENYINWQ